MNISRLLKIVAIVAASMITTVSAKAQEAIDLTIVAGHPPIFLWVKLLNETFIPGVDAELAKSGKYKINWNRAYGGTLAKVGKEIDAIGDGIADLGTSFSLFSPDKLPLQNISYIAPFHSDDPAIVGEIVTELQNEIPQMGNQWEKYNQVYLGGGLQPDAYHLWTNFPIRSLDDLKGHKIGAPGSAANWIKGTGAIAVASNLPEYYNSLKAGVFDGVIVFATAASVAKLHEVAKYVTLVNFGSTFAGGITVNKDRWNEFPEEVKQAFKTAIVTYEKDYVSQLKQRTAGALERIKAAGADIQSLTPKQRAEFAHMLPNIAKNWATDLDAKGLPGTEVLNGFMQKMRDKNVQLARDWDKE